MGNKMELFPSLVDLELRDSNGWSNINFACPSLTSIWPDKLIWPEPCVSGCRVGRYQGGFSTAPC